MKRITALAILQADWHKNLKIGVYAHEPLEIQKEFMRFMKIPKSQTSPCHINLANGGNVTFWAFEEPYKLCGVRHQKILIEGTEESVPKLIYQEVIMPMACTVLNPCLHERVREELGCPIPYLWSGKTQIIFSG